jgi:DNA polymerase-3 subunit beta
MKNSFTVAAGQLTGAVKYTARWLATKPVIPTHGGLLFEVDGDRLNIFGFNENVTARATVEIDASDEPKGGFVVAGRLIDALVATFPDKPIRFEQDGATVAVTAGRFRATLPAMSEKDYPALPGQATLAGMVDGATLADATRRVGAAASRDLSSKVALCGIHVAFDDDPATGPNGKPVHTLTMTATDTYRAARQSIEWYPDSENAPIGEAFLVLGMTLVDAAEAFIGPDAVAVGWENGVVSLTTPWRSLVVRTLSENEFPSTGLAPIFATATQAEATLRVKDLAMPLKRVDLLRARDVDMVRLAFSENTITLVAESGPTGGGDEEIDVEYGGPETTVALKSSVLHSALQSAPGEHVTLAFNPGTFKPMIVTSPADPTWRHVMVPLRSLGGNS